MYYFGVTRHSWIREQLRVEAQLRLNSSMWERKQNQRSSISIFCSALAWRLTFEDWTKSLASISLSPIPCNEIHEVLRRVQCSVFDLTIAISEPLWCTPPSKKFGVSSTPPSQECATWSRSCLRKMSLHHPVRLHGLGRCMFLVFVEMLLGMPHPIVHVEIRWLSDPAILTEPSFFISASTERLKEANHLTEAGGRKSMAATAHCTFHARKAINGKPRCNAEWPIASSFWRDELLHITVKQNFPQDLSAIWGFRYPYKQ